MEALFASRDVEDRSIKLTAAQSSAVDIVNSLISSGKLVANVPISLSGAQTSAIQTAAGAYASSLIPSVLSIVSFLGNLAGSVSAASTISSLFTPLSQGGSGKLVPGVAGTVAFSPAEISALQTIATVGTSAGGSNSLSSLFPRKNAQLTATDIAAVHFFAVLSGSGKGNLGNSTSTSTSNITGLGGGSGSQGILNLALGGLFSSIIKVTLSAAQTAAINVVNALNAAGKITAGAANFSGSELNSIHTLTNLYLFLRIFIHI